MLRLAKLLSLLCCFSQVTVAAFVIFLGSDKAMATDNTAAKASLGVETKNKFSLGAVPFSPQKLADNKTINNQLCSNQKDNNNPPHENELSQIMAGEKNASIISSGICMTGGSYPTCNGAVTFLVNIPGTTLLSATYNGGFCLLDNSYLAMSNEVAYIPAKVTCLVNQPVGVSQLFILSVNVDPDARGKGRIYLVSTTGNMAPAAPGASHQVGIVARGALAVQQNPIYIMGTQPRPVPLPPPPPGPPRNYGRLVITNTGPSTAKGVEVNEVLPLPSPGVLKRSLSIKLLDNIENCEILPVNQGISLHCRRGELEPNESWVIQFSPYLTDPIPAITEVLSLPIQVSSDLGSVEAIGEITVVGGAVLAVHKDLPKQVLLGDQFVDSIKLLSINPITQGLEADFIVNYGNGFKVLSVDDHKSSSPVHCSVSEDRSQVNCINSEFGGPQSGLSASITVEAIRPSMGDENINLAWAAGFLGVGEYATPIEILDSSVNSSDLPAGADDLIKQYPSGSYYDYAKACIDVHWEHIGGKEIYLSGRCSTAALPSWDLTLDYMESCVAGSKVFYYEPYPGAILDKKDSLICEQAKDRPQGSYLDGCKDIVWNGVVLGASCKRDSGTGQAFLTNELEYTSACAAGSTVSTNDAGELVCDIQQSYPAGTYLKTCTLKHWDGSTLTASCLAADQTLRESSLEYTNECVPVSAVSNNDGRLSCDVKKSPLPQGPYETRCYDIVWDGALLFGLCSTDDSRGPSIKSAFLNYHDDCEAGSEVTVKDGDLKCVTPITSRAY